MKVVKISPQAASFPNVSSALEQIESDLVENKRLLEERDVRLKAMEPEIAALGDAFWSAYCNRLNLIDPTPDWGSLRKPALILGSILRTPALIGRYGLRILKVAFQHGLRITASNSKPGTDDSALTFVALCFGLIWLLTIFGALLNFVALEADKAFLFVVPGGIGTLILTLVYNAWLKPSPQEQAIAACGREVHLFFGDRRDSVIIGMPGKGWRRFNGVSALHQTGLALPGRRGWVMLLEPVTGDTVWFHDQNPVAVRYHGPAARAAKDAMKAEPNYHDLLDRFVLIARAEALVTELKGTRDEILAQQKRLATAEACWRKIALPNAIKTNLIQRIDRFASGQGGAKQGVLLHGPPGTGKTLIAKTIAETAGYKFFSVKLPDLKMGYVGQSAQRVRELWNEIRTAGQAIVFLDECDSVFGRRGSVSTDSYIEEIVSSFLAEWDGVGSDGCRVMVVGATNRKELIDEAILSRFGISILVPLPEAEQRRAILNQELQQAGLGSFKVTDELVEETNGMSGRDLSRVAEEVANHAHLRTPTEKDFLQAIFAIRGKRSTGKDDAATWDALVISEHLKKKLKTYCFILKQFEQYRKLGVGLPKGLLLFGPPGTGKTQIARTLANESGLGFIGCTTADLKAGFLGQSGQKVKEIFERARSQSPCILFFDELDIIAPSRGPNGDCYTQEIVGQLLQEMDGINPQTTPVFFVGATNRPEQIDPAVLNRFTERIAIGLPDEAARRKLMAIMIGKRPVEVPMDELVAEIAACTDGYSGRDLKALLDNATMRAIQRAAELGDPSKLILKRSDFTPLKDEGETIDESALHAGSQIGETGDAKRLNRSAQACIC